MKNKVKQRVPDGLETERLLLRQITEADVEPLHHYYSDPDATRYTVGRPLSFGESWRTVSSMLGHWHLKGYGPYVLELKEQGSVVGVSGFWYPGDWPEAEIKWALISRFTGNGFASEAARALQNVARECFEKPLISLIHEDNQNSINLAKAVGAGFEREHQFRGGTWLIYRHPDVGQ